MVTMKEETDNGYLDKGQALEGARCEKSERNPKKNVQQICELK